MAQVSELVMLAQRNPAYKALYRTALERCAETCDAQDAVRHVNEARSSAKQLQEAPAILASLVKHGGLKHEVLVNGAPYAGTMTDLRSDQNIPEDAEVKETYTTTPAGHEFLELSAPAAELAAVYEQNPEHAAGFDFVLDVCRGVGMSTRDLQAALTEAHLLGSERKAEQVHASFFTAVLEEAGVLEWKDGRWVTR